MNSIRNQATARCPHGCEPFDVNYYCFVRADENPELKEAVLGGELNLVRCPTCGSYFHHDGEIIFLDPAGELLVFVFAAADAPRRAAMEKRMAEDYRLVKDTLLESLKLDYPPVCVFGLDELKHLLEDEEKVGIESEAVAAAAAAEGFKVLRLKPAYARTHHFPHYIPAPQHAGSPCDYAVAAAKVLKSGLHSSLLLNFKDHMSQEGAVLPLLV